MVLKDEPEECLHVGRYPIPNTNCSNYLICTKTKELTGHRANCPSNLYFDPRRQRCSANYICIDYICQSDDILEENFYLDPNDTTNKTYINCAFDEVYGILTASLHRCPTGSSFVVENSQDYNKGDCIENKTEYSNTDVLKLSAITDNPLPFKATTDNWIKNKAIIKNIHFLCIYSLFVYMVMYLMVFVNL